jgi:hypothetical protein
MDGTAAAGTAAQFTRGDHVHPTDTSRAPLASPTFTGTPAAPTVTPATDSTTKLATTAFVQSAITATAYTAGNGINIASHVISAVGVAGFISVGVPGITIDPAYVGQTSITTLGTIATGTWNGTTIGVAKGGTGAVSLTAHGLLIGEGTAAVAATAVGSSNQILIGQSGADPIWATTLPGAALPAYTGDVTSPAGGTVNTLVNIPNATTAAGAILFSNIAAPATPAAGKVQLYTDSTNNILAAKNSAGTVSSTVVPSTAPSNQFATGLSVSGVLAYAQPSVGNLSGLPVTVSQGGTGAITLTGYVKGAGTSALTAVGSIPNTDITGLGTMATQNASAVAITGGTIDGIVFDGGTF